MASATRRCAVVPGSFHVSRGPCDHNITRCGCSPHTTLALSTGTTLRLQNIRNQATILQWNACGLHPRLSDLRQFVSKQRFPIIAISESNLRSKVRISGYSLLESTTDINRSRVLLAIRNDLSFVVHSVPQDSSNEYVAATVPHKAVKFTVINGYIPPRVRFDTNRLHSILANTPSPHVLTGDFNAHHPAWGSRSTSSRGNRLLNVATNAGLHVLNTGSATFVRGKTSSVLDVTLLSTSLLLFASWFADVESFGSDHLPTYTIIKGICGGPQKLAVHGTNWQKFRDFLEDSSTTLNTHEKLADAVSSARAASEKHCLLPQEASAVDIEYERLRAIRRRAERRARKTASPDDIRHARRAQKHVQKHIRKLAKQRWSQFCS